MKATSTSPLRISFFIVCMAFFSNIYAFELSCPSDVTINCGDEIYNLSIYGQAQYKDYSGWHDAGNASVYYDLDNCGLGHIVRTWTVWNPYGMTHVSCSQHIYVGGSYFSEANINWPKTPLDVSGCNPNVSPNNLPPGYQKPTWSSGSCALIGSSYTDKVFYFSGACKKIVRTWEIINCCVHNPYTGEGLFTFNQEINVTISDVPQVTCPGDIMMESYDCQGAYVEVPGIEVPDTECSEFVTIMNDSPYSDGGADASGNYPLGTTVVTFTADYGCWQKTMCQVEVTVNDATAPTPYCIYGLSIALMGIDADGDGVNEDGMVDVWASDLDKGSFASCNSNSPLTFSFSDDPSDNSRTFTCEDVGRNDVEIWVTDEYGRQNYCHTYVRIQNNGANIEDCEDSDDFSVIAGTVQSHHGKYMDNLEIKAVATSHEGEDYTYETYEIVETIIDSIQNGSGATIYILDIDTVLVTVTETVYDQKTFTTTQLNNAYMLGDMQHFHDYRIYGIAEDPDQSLIDLADVQLIEDYISGVEEFTAYQKMAADVNADGMIDAADVEILQAVIAGNPPADFDNNWHFMDANFDLENMPEEHECEEFCRVMDLKEDTYKVNLVGLRMGDVTDVRIATSDDKLRPEIADNDAVRMRSKVDSWSFTATPNPFTNQLFLNVSAVETTSTNFVLRNEVGQIIMSKQVNILQGNNEINVNINDDLSAGLYLYEIQLGDQLVTGKLIHMK